MLKKIILLIVVVLAVILGVFLLTKDEQTKMTVVKEAYNMVGSNENKNTICLKMYINKKNTYISDINKIANSYICDFEEEEIMKVNIIKIDYIKKIKIEKEKYYFYQIVIEVDSIFKTNLLIEKAYLKNTYKHDMEIKINIGTFSYYFNTDNSNDINIVNLKGIINEIDHKKTLTGVALKINNNINKNIIVRNIKMLDLNMIIENINITDINNIDHNNIISDITGIPYKLFDCNENIKNINFTLDEERSILLTIDYLNHYEINNVGIMIEYFIDNTLKHYYLYPFNFFTNYYRTIDVNELTFYYYE